MDITTFQSNFEVTTIKCQYIPNGQKDITNLSIISDTIDFSWNIKCKINDISRTFSVAYNVEDDTLTLNEHAKKAFLLRKDDIFDWASIVILDVSLVGKQFIPF